MIQTQADPEQTTTAFQKDISEKSLSFENIFQASPTAMAVLETRPGKKNCLAGLCITRVNNAFEQISRLSGSVVKGMTLHDIFPELKEQVPPLSKQCRDEHKHWAKFLCSFSDILVRDKSRDQWLSVKFGHMGEKAVIVSFEQRHFKNSRTDQNPHQSLNKYQAKTQGVQLNPEKKTDAELQRIEETLRGIFNAIESAVIMVNRYGHITLANQCTSIMFGYEMNEILGRKYSTLVHPLERDEAKEKTDRLISGKRLIASEDRLFLKADGSTFLGHISGQRLYFPDGTLWSLLGVITDITKQKTTYEALLRSESRHRTLINAIPDLVLLKDENGAILSCNKSFEQIVGKSESEMIGKSVSEMLNPYPAELIRKNDFDAITSGKKIVFEENVVFPDTGIQRTFEIIKTAVYDQSESLIGILGVARDITEKKRIEEKMMVQNEILGSVINSFGDSLLIINQNHIIEFQNDSAKARLGCVTGQPCHQMIFKKKSPCRHCQILDVLKNNTQKQVEVDLPNQKRYEITFSPFPGRQIREKTVVLLRDVTEKKNLQEEAIRASHLASIGELAAGVAHEINNPVSGIMGLAEILADQLEQMGQSRSIPERIINESERISKIVRNLLSFSRNNPDERRIIAAADILEKTLTLIETQLFKDGITLEISSQPDLPPIKSNWQEIQQVFLNIISNARYALNQRSNADNIEKKIRINLHSIRKNQCDYIEISFTDNGTGISQTIINSIADPFFSTKPQGEGTGLGLSISHGIINRHDGYLFFESDGNSHTTVRIILPAETDPVETEQTAIRQKS